MFTTYITALFTGCLAGMLGAFLGVSGGIIMLPASQFILGLSTLSAVGTSLFAGFFTTLSGAYGHFRSGNIWITKALLIASGGLCGIFLGSHLFKVYLSANTTLLQFLLGLLFLLMSLRMVGEVREEWTRKDDEAHPPRVQSEKASWIALVLLGLTTGIIAGVFGVGGGFILVPVLIWVFAAKPCEAAGTSLLAMLPYIAAGGFIKLRQGFVDLHLGLLLGLGAIIGAQLGVVINRKVNPLTFKIIFTLIFIYLSWKYMSPLALSGV